MGPVSALKWLSGRLRWEWFCLPGCGPPSSRARVGVGHRGKHLSSRDEQVGGKASRAAGLPAGVCQTTEPQALVGSLGGPVARTQAPKSSFLVASGPRASRWVRQPISYSALDLAPPPSTGDIVGLFLTFAGPGQQDFALPSTLWGGHDSAHFYEGQGAQEKEPRAKRLFARPKGTQRELDLDSKKAQARGRSRKEVSGPEGTGVETAPDTAPPPPPPSSFSPRPESETGDTKVKLKLLPGSQARLQRGKEKERG